MVITLEYIMKHRTKRGSWNGSQFKALGIEQTKGWKNRLIGTEITYVQAMEFEAGAGINYKKTRADNKKKALEGYTPNEASRVDKAIQYLVARGYNVIDSNGVERKGLFHTD